MSGRILIVDDIPVNRMMLKTKLADAYYDVSTASTGEEAQARARQEQPDMILLDMELPDMNGGLLCSLLKSDPETRHIPVIILTDTEAHEDRILGVDVGADDFLTKPIDDLALFARVRNLMRMKIMFDELHLRDDTSRKLGLDNFIVGTEQDNDRLSGLLMVASAAEHAQPWLDMLSENLRIDAHLVLDEARALELSITLEPDIFIIQHHLHGGQDGLRFISNIRANPKSRQAAIIFVAEPGDMKSAAAALDLGATDFVMAPVDINELVARTRSQIKRKRFTDRLRSNVLDGLKMAVQDPLTGLFNRRYAAKHIQSMMDRSDPNLGGVAVMMLDLDNFKAVNDSLGHEAGDHVLQEFALRLQENVRGVDLVARLGGEEFCVAMPDTDVEIAAMAAERVRAAIERTPFHVATGSTPIEVTVSVGVAVSQEPDLTVEEALNRADMALYVSKHKGRNRVSFFKEAA